MFPVDFAVITFVGIDGCAACYVFQQWFEMITFVGIGRGGFAADCPTFVYFDGLALFAAGGLDDSGINNGCLCFLDFEAFFGELAVNQCHQLG